MKESRMKKKVERSCKRNYRTTPAHKISNNTASQSESNESTQMWKTLKHTTRKTRELLKKAHQNLCKTLSQEDEDENEDDTLEPTSVSKEQKEMGTKPSVEQHDVCTTTIEVLEALLSETYKVQLTVEN